MFFRLLIILLFATTANAAVITLNSGDSVQNAVDAANPYDVIQLNEGAFNLPSELVIDKPLTLKGQGKFITTVNNTGQNGVTIRVLSDNVNLTSFSIEGNDAPIVVDGKAANAFTRVNISNLYSNTIDTVSDGVRYESAGGSIINSEIFVTSTNTSGSQNRALSKWVKSDTEVDTELILVNSIFSNTHLKTSGSFINRAMMNWNDGANQSSKKSVVRAYNCRFTSDNTQSPSNSGTLAKTEAVESQGAYVETYIYDGIIFGGDLGAYSNNWKSIRSDDGAITHIYGTRIAPFYTQSQNGGEIVYHNSTLENLFHKEPLAANAMQDGKDLHIKMQNGADVTSDIWWERARNGADLILESGEAGVLYATDQSVRDIGDSGDLILRANGDLILKVGSEEGRIYLADFEGIKVLAMD